MGVLCSFAFYLFLLLLQLHIADEADGNSGQYDAYNTKGIGTSITVGNRRSIGTKDCGTGLVGSTKSGRVGNSSTEHTHHHCQVVSRLSLQWTSLIEDQEEKAYGTSHVKQDDGNRHHVEPDS